MVASKEDLAINSEGGKTPFIICNKDKSWILLRAETMEEAISKAREEGKEPRYVVEEKLSTSIR